MAVIFTSWRNQILYVYSFLLLLFSLFYRGIDEIFATATASTDVIGGKLCAVVKIFTGATAKAVATVAIVLSF